VILCRIRKSRCVTPPGSSYYLVCQSLQTVCTFDQKSPPRPSRSQSSRSRGSQQHIHETDTSPRYVFRTLAPSTEVASESLVRELVSNEGAVNQSPVSFSTSSHRSSPIAESCRGDREFGVQKHRSASPGDATRSSRGGDGDSLGLSKSEIAELYGLTSDMEPILMVSKVS
jgi:hypothetical protein